MTPEAGNLQALLQDAEVLGERDAYPPYDCSRARRAIARAAARSLCERAQQAGPPHPDTPGDPGSARTQHEQAARDLRMLCRLVAGEDGAAEKMACLVNDPRVIDADGAAVYACVIKLIGANSDEAQYWWQFAAGAGSHTAAYCLHLHHLAHGEMRDSRFWQRQAAQLAPRRKRTPPSEADDFVLAELLLAYAVAETHRLPDTRALAAARSRLPGSQDSECGPFFPTPDPQLLVVQLSPAR